MPMLLKIRLSLTSLPIYYCVCENLENLKIANFNIGLCFPKYF